MAKSYQDKFGEDTKRKGLIQHVNIFVGPLNGKSILATNVGNSHDYVKMKLSPYLIIETRYGFAIRGFTIKLQILFLDNLPSPLCGDTIFAVMFSPLRGTTNICVSLRKY